MLDRMNCDGGASKGVYRMKQLVMLVLTAGNLGRVAEIYVSVNGNAQADGSLTRPYGSLPDAVKAAILVFIRAALHSS